MNIKHKLIVFSHLMKTGGTSLNQHLKGSYGTKMHIVTKKRNNCSINTSPYNINEFQKDLENYSDLRVISGHQVRPFVDFGEYENSFLWFIILRHPYKRFVSHYIQETNREGFNHKGETLESWTNRFNTSNYMTKFIAGSDDLELAKKLLKEKYQVVGLTEELELSINLMRSVSMDKKFKLPRESHKNKSTDSSLKNKLLKSKLEFIKQNNDLDLQLYNFVKNDIWPNQLLKIDLSKLDYNKNSLITETINKLLFQKKRYKYHSEKITLGNIKYFLRNW